MYIYAYVYIFICMFGNSVHHIHHVLKCMSCNMSASVDNQDGTLFL